MPRYITQSDGSLYRYTDQYQIGMNSAENGKTIRQNFSIHHRTIDSVADLKATLRAGEFAWPGGYPLYFITSDGGALSFESVRAELYQVIYSIRHQISDGWRVVACEVNYEDTDLYCDHSGKRIAYAYSD